MTIMLRPRKSIATTIAFKILGVPANMRNRNTEQQRKLARALNRQNTSFVR